MLLDRQLLLLGKVLVLRAPQDSPLHAVSFIPGTTEPATSRYIRRVGRPRKEWVPTMLQEVYRSLGVAQLPGAAESETAWKCFVKS